MCTLWQQFGRAGCSLLLDAIAILFVEPSHTDAKRNKKEARLEKQATGKGKRSVSKSRTQGWVNKWVAVKREAAEGSTQQRPDHPTGGTEDMNDYEAKCREEYGPSVAEPSWKNALAKLEPAMDDFVNAVMSLLIRYIHIPFYFHCSFTSSVSLIHHYVLQLHTITLTLASLDRSWLFDGYMIYDSHVFTSILSISNMRPPVVWPITSPRSTQSGTSLQMSLMLTFLFSICI